MATSSSTSMKRRTSSSAPSIITMRYTSPLARIVESPFLALRILPAPVDVPRQFDPTRHLDDRGVLNIVGNSDGATFAPRPLEGFAPIHLLG